MYLTNFVALDLGLEGTPDPSWEVVNLAVIARDYKGYVCPEYGYATGTPPQTAQQMPAPAPPDLAGPGNSGGNPGKGGGGSAASSAKQSRKG